MVMKIYSCAMLCSMIILFGSCTFSDKTTKMYLDNARTMTYDIIAVPGVPFTGSGWDSTMKARVYWSKYLFDKGIAKNIMFSGSSVRSPYYEGEIMALYAIALGIPEENVFTETKAEHSTENLYYAFLKAKKLGFEKIALATEPFQSKVLRRFARNKIKEEINVIPFVYDTLDAIRPYMTDPQINYMEAFNEKFIPLKLRESFWKRRRGTLGKNIDPNAY